MHSNKVKKLVEHLKRNKGFIGIPKSNSGPSQNNYKLPSGRPKKIKGFRGTTKKKLTLLVIIPQKLGK